MKKFTYKGKPGTIDQYDFIYWNGTGFHLSIADRGIKASIKRQTEDK